MRLDQTWILGAIAVLGGLAGGALLPSAASAQEGRLPTFRSEVEVVNLHVSVTDTQHRFVTGLAETDFTVLEDGVPQQLCAFLPQRVPFTLAVLIDTSLSMQPHVPAVQAAAVKLLGTLGPDDEAQVVQFNHRYNVLQPFSFDRDALAAAVRRIQAEGGTGVYNAVYVSVKELQARRKEGEVRRRAIVVLSDGKDTTSLVTDDQALRVAREGDVAVYTISLAPHRPVGLAETGVATHFLTAVARDTGGQAFFPTSLNQLEGVYDRVADELRSQYALGYVSKNDRKDGKWRRIAILTSRSLRLRHRLGYYAAAGGRRLSAVYDAGAAGGGGR